MRRGRRSSKRRVQLTWVISYALVILLPMIAWVYVQSLSNRIIEDMTSDLNRDVLDIMVSKVDGEIDSLMSMVPRIAVDSDVRIAVGNQERTGGSVAYRNRQIRDMLSDYKASNGYISNLYIYFCQSGRVISDETSVDAATYYFLKYADLRWTLDQWKHALEAPFLYEFSQFDFVSGQDTVVLLYTLGTSGVMADARGVEATLVVEMSPDAFGSMVQGVHTEDGIGISISSPQGDTIFAVEARYDQGDVISLTNVSGRTGWQYTLHVPEEVYMSRSAGVQRIMVYVFAATSVFGTILIVIFTKRNYDPIRSLMELVRSRTQEPATPPRDDEYQFLQEAFTSIADRRDEDLALLRRTYLSDLMQGGASVRMHPQESLRLLGFDYMSSVFAVAVVKGGKVNEGLDRIAQALKIGSMPDSVFYGYAAAFGDHTAFLLDCTDLSTQEYTHRARQLQALLARRDAPCVLAFSDIHSGAYGVAEAYREARYSLAFADMLGEPFALYSEMGELGSGVFYYPPQAERRLISAINNQDMQEITAVIDHLWQRNITESKIGIALVRFLATSVLNTMLKASETLGRDMQGLQLRSMWEMDEPRSIHQIRELLLDVAGKLCAAAMENAQGADTSLKAQITAYVDEHFFDPSVNVERITQVFGKSVSYVSRLFSADDGDGLLAYINDKRIERAKQILLEDRNVQINDVYPAVGYTNINTFMRQFKKHEGITPGKYKEIMHAMRIFSGESKK